MSSLVYAVLAAAGNLVGAVAITARPRWAPRTLELFLAFSAGFLVAVAVTGLLPEALAHYKALGLDEDLARIVVQLTRGDERRMTAEAAAKAFYELFEATPQ